MLYTSLRTQIKDDKGYHLYTLHIKVDNTFEIYIDTESVSQGSLLEDFEPPVHLPQEIDDPEDTQPEGWVTAVRTTAFLYSPDMLGILSCGVAYPKHSRGSNCACLQAVVGMGACLNMRRHYSI